MARVRDRGMLSQVIEHRHLNNRIFALAGLGMYKPLHKIPGLGPVWENAFRALQEASEIIVVGFSCSDFDGMVRLHFSTIMRERLNSGNAPVVTVIDPSADDPSFQQRMEDVFGPCKWMPLSHSAVDWETPVGS